MSAKLQVIEPAAFKVGFDVPSPGGGGRRKHPELHHAMTELAKAPIGAGFLAPDVKISAIQQVAWRLGGGGWVTIRKSDDGFRVWKIAEPRFRS